MSRALLASRVMEWSRVAQACNSTVGCQPGRESSVIFSCCMDNYLSPLNHSVVAGRWRGWRQQRRRGQQSCKLRAPRCLAGLLQNCMKIQCNMGGAKATGEQAGQRHRSSCASKRCRRARHALCHDHGRQYISCIQKRKVSSRSKKNLSARQGHAGWARSTDQKPDAGNVHWNCS